MGYRGDVPYKENKEYLQEQIIGLNRFLSERLHLYDGERQAMFLVRKMEERMCKKELWEKSCYQEIWGASCGGIPGERHFCAGVHPGRDVSESQCDAFGETTMK